MVKEGSLLVQTAIASAVCNLYSEDRDEFSNTVKTEGWTEVWGDESMDSSADCWKLEEAAAANSNVSRSDAASRLLPDISLTIVQYRPAWLEQLVLRIAGIPHVVINSPYHSTESTGCLPYLKDTSSSQHPVLVGRTQPGTRFRKAVQEEEATGEKESLTSKPEPRKRPLQQENSILDYLQSQRGIDLDAHLKTPSSNHSDNNKNEFMNPKQALSNLLKLLITTKLEQSLLILRYEDEDAWGQVYRKQCLESSRNNNPQSQVDDDDSEDTQQGSLWRRLPTVRGLYQAWSERILVRKALRFGKASYPPSYLLEDAKKEVRKAYNLLEHQLKQRSSQETNYLLDTSEPAMVDAILWAHLADALCDVNLVTILADFPLLVKYFQRIYDKYFATTSSSGSVAVVVGSQDPEAWKVWNKHENFGNPFHQIPLEANIMRKSKKHELANKYTHALELMQTLSVRDHDLLETLRVGKAARAKDVALLMKRASPNQASNSAPAVPPTSEDKPELSALEKARRQQQRSDQVWISIVGGAAVVAMAFSVLNQ